MQTRTQVQRQYREAVRLFKALPNDGTQQNILGAMFAMEDAYGINQEGISIGRFRQCVNNASKAMRKINDQEGFV